MEQPRQAEELWQSLTASLWADAGEKAEADFAHLPLLAHYTSISTMESIVKNDEIWFSNPLFMNDIEEVRWGINRGVSEYLENPTIADALVTDARHEHFQKCLVDCVRRFESNHMFDTYTLCLSAHEDSDGLLSMWRGYGDSGKGVAIVFDGSPMTEQPASSLIVGRVDYLSTEQRLQWFEAQANILAARIIELNLIDDGIRLAAEALFGRLRLASLFSKHVGFSEEKEWRIAYLPERDNGKLLHQFRGYHLTSKGVEPKLKLKIAPIEGVIDNVVSLDNLVTTILLGPSLQDALLELSVQRMLELMGKTGLAAKVKASRIPFRPAGVQF